MEHSQQAQSKSNNIETQSSASDFEGVGADFMPSIGIDGVLHGGQDGYTPKQVMQLQRTLGNQVTLQLMRKTEIKPRDFTRLKMVQRDENSGGLPPPPDYDNEESNEAPPLFSEATGLDPTTQNRMPVPESSIKGIVTTDAVLYASKVFRAYMTHLQGDPNDKTFTQYWSDQEVDRVAEGWIAMDEKEKKNNQYALSELIKEDQRLEVAVSAKQFEQSDESVGKVLEGLEGGVNLTSVTSAGFSTGEGVKLAVQLKDGISAVNTSAGVFEATLGSVLGIAWLPFVIGYEVVKAFGYHKKRRDGYKSRMDALEGNQKTEDDIKLYDISKYAYKKTRRAFIYSMTKIALKIVRMIALLITLLTGGTSAVVTASIAAIAAATETSALLFRKIKGLGKLLTGSRGKNRQKNSEELVKLAKGGSADAAQTIIDVDPFDAATMKILRSLGNDLGSALMDSSLNPVTNSRKVMQGLEKPDSAETLIFMLEKTPEEGGWSVEHETMLARALANTMVSQ